MNKVPQSVLLILAALVVICSVSARELPVQQQKRLLSLTPNRRLDQNGAAFGNVFKSDTTDGVGDWWMYRFETEKIVYRVSVLNNPKLSRPQRDLFRTKVWVGKHFCGRLEGGLVGWQDVQCTTPIKGSFVMLTTVSSDVLFDFKGVRIYGLPAPSGQKTGPVLSKSKPKPKPKPNGTRPATGSNGSKPKPKPKPKGKPVSNGSKPKPKPKSKGQRPAPVWIGQNSDDGSIVPVEGR